MAYNFLKICLVAFFVLNNPSFVLSALEGVEAVKAFSEIISQHPDDPKPYFNRGIAYAHMGSLAKVTETYLSPPAEFPDSVDMAQNQEIIDEHRENIKMAIADFTKTIELKETYVEAYHYRAVLLFLAGDFESSLADAKKLYDLGHPANPKFLGALMGSAQKKGISI